MSLYVHLSTRFPQQYEEADVDVWTAAATRTGASIGIDLDFDASVVCYVLCTTNTLLRHTQHLKLDM